MTLITVVCYDFVIFSRSKSRTFEKSTLSPVRLFYENSGAEKIICISLFRPFYVRLKTLRRKNNLSDFAGTNVLSSAKTRLPRILTETL